MHKVEVKGILSAQNGMNIYRGCSHGCIYCDARSTCYQMKHAFEDIEVKMNAPDLLEDALRKKRKRCMIGTGAMCDPYLHIEKDLMLTRRCLELIDTYGYGVAIQTKSDRILRDLDLLQSINCKTKAVVQMTLTTADESLCKIVEPDVCSTQRRFEVLLRMKEAGIPTVVWMSPILPFINDTEENILRILDYCHRAGVYGIITFGIGLTLRDGDRQHFYKCLDNHFPGVKQKYQETYGDAYEIPSLKSKQLYSLFQRTCAKYGIETDTNTLFSYLHTFEEKGMGEQISFV
ncbi:MAG TPA: radical SAM protein [Lachnospiraceae bacterium]|nr:radical SAM protein [Lachnospiraceae bacterium]